MWVRLLADLPFTGKPPTCQIMASILRKCNSFKQLLSVHRAPCKAFDLYINKFENKIVKGPGSQNKRVISK